MTLRRTPVEQARAPAVVGPRRWVTLALASTLSALGLLTLTAAPAFAANQPLKVTVTGPGTVYDNYGYIACSETGGACEAEIEEGTPLTLYAYSTERSAFSHWQGCESENANKCNITIGATPAEVKVTFTALPQQTLTVTNSGAGTIIGTSPGPEFTPIDCGNGAATCTETYNEGATIILFATPNERSSTPIVWHGCAATPSETECEVTMSAAKSVKAEFAPIPQQTLTVNTRHRPGAARSSAPPPASNSMRSTAATVPPPAAKLQPGRHDHPHRCPKRTLRRLGRLDRL